MIQLSLLTPRVQIVLRLLPAQPRRTITVQAVPQGPGLVKARPEGAVVKLLKRAVGQ